jgi:hypothetical protein
MWDVTYDDVMDVEIRNGEHVQHTRVPALGGRPALDDAGALANLEIDCARPELVCPGEIWPSELRLDNRTGDLSDDGEEMVVSFVGEGRARCRFEQGSVAQAEVQTKGSPTGAWQANVLSEGRMTLVLPSACFGKLAGLGNNTQIALSIGFTAARR